jgi:hypothetical protein
LYRELREYIDQRRLLRASKRRRAVFAKSPAANCVFRRSCR